MSINTLHKGDDDDADDSDSDDDDDDNNNNNNNLFSIPEIHQSDMKLVIR